MVFKAIFSRSIMNLKTDFQNYKNQLSRIYTNIYTGYNTCLVDFSAL